MSGSAADARARLPRTWRPLGPRIAGGGLVLVVMAMVLWFTFDEETRDAISPLQRGTVLALGAAMLALLHALARSRVVAETGRLTVVNGYRRRDLAWAEVVAVRLPPGAPWVTLDLADGSTCAAMGIQGSDGQRAKDAVRELRGLVDAPPG
jgi:hypothetical protein